MKSILPALLLLLTCSPAFADGWTTNFTITGLFVSVQNNFQYRVYGLPPVASCTNGTTWAYINDSDGGSTGYYAALLTAFTTGKQITLNLVTVNGYCHIVELEVIG
jgi:hypothetical protein